MYVYKHPNSVYYTRICTPKKLVKLGFPFDFKISLRTKNRPVALRRNLVVAPIVIQSLDKWAEIDAFTPDVIDDYKAALLQSISDTWLSIEAGHPAHAYNPRTHKSSQNGIQPLSKKKAPLHRWLAEFIHSKKQQNITALTVHQLNQRISHFIAFYDKQSNSAMSSALLMAYVDHLNSQKRSPKTNKEFLAAIKQFFKWLEAVQEIPSNPAKQMTATFRTHQHASEERLRWSKDELEHLFNHHEFKQSCPSVQWVSLLQLYMGLRPSEACQLRVSDISISTPIPSVSITDKGTSQRVKNKHAIRTVPIHPQLIELGFLNFVTAQQRNQLFKFKPLGENQDWSKAYRTQFARLQNKLGMKAHKRPTCYGFRHTFIDTLKQKGVEEVRVAEVVGHANHNMTYGRYGKRLNLFAMLDIVSQFTLSGEENQL
ncbi:tyrosine-type recombinase/integrase [Vibrio comitans]|uniref:Integrase n=1 Tax=Vibrio comitans NBRC 102076 TaxID=1219078 RepID=A0A4Y3IUU0_9VIBR|nr:tyrosine-type recombinase/integrase [Vibrio comitans]GEA62548.1 integrase [Vibrio comitans NBRC 102076]